MYVVPVVMSPCWVSTVMASMSVKMVVEFIWNVTFNYYSSASVYCVFFVTAMEIIVEYLHRGIIVCDGVVVD
jgi:hypothetical protein